MQNPRLNRLEMCDIHGVRSESTYVPSAFSLVQWLTPLFPQRRSPTYYERFRDAFVTEIRDFSAAVLDDTRTWLPNLLFFVEPHCRSAALPITLDDAVEAAKIAVALTWAYVPSFSLREGKVLMVFALFPRADLGLDRRFISMQRGNLLSRAWRRFRLSRY